MWIVRYARVSGALRSRNRSVLSRERYVFAARRFLVPAAAELWYSRGRVTLSVREREGAGGNPAAAQAIEALAREEFPFDR